MDKLDKKYGLSVIFPVYNEEKNIRPVLDSAIKYLSAQHFFSPYEIIVVNDGSTDQTGDILREHCFQVPQLKILANRNNLGYGKTLIKGIKEASLPWVLLIDADGQFDIREIEKFIPYIAGYDLIIGCRELRRDNYFRIILGRLYAWLACYGLGLNFKDINCGFKLLKKEILEFSNFFAKAGVFYAEVLLHARNKGYLIKEIPVKHFYRTGGIGSGASLKVIFDSVIDLIILYLYNIRGKRI